MNLEIHFPVSRSVVYPEVLKRARLFSNFTEKPNVLRILDVDELFGRWDDFSLVIFSTTKWAGTNVFFEGKPVLPYKNEFFYKLLDIKHCYGQFKESVYKPGYCSGSDWGCYRLKQLGRYFTASGYYINNPFYKQGYLSGKDTWMIDKAKILSILLEEAAIKLVHSCPAFDPERIKTKVSDLPEKIQIDEHWEVDYKLDISTTGVVGIPTSLNFVPNPEPEPQPPEDEFIEPGSDEHLDKLLKDRDKKRPDEYSDLL